MRFERSHDVVIQASPAEVLDYVSNPTSWPEWMPATHEIESPDRPLQAGERFFEQWGTGRGEVTLDWLVVERDHPRVWAAETEAAFLGPIMVRYAAEDAEGRTRFTRTVVNPARPKPPTPEMIQRVDEEAAVCLANIKRAVEDRSRRGAGLRAPR